MMIIGFDPGFDRLGIAVIEKTKRGERLVFSKCITTDKKLSYANRLFSLGEEISKILQKYKPERAGIEDLFFEKNQKTAMRVAGVSGLIQYLCAAKGVEPFIFSPLSIKSAVLGYGRGDKSQIIFMVQKILSIPAQKRLDDEYDAIAVALTLSAQTRVI